MNQHKYLLKPDPRKSDEKMFSCFLPRKSVKIPRDTDYRSKMPPIWNQGDLGACQSYAADSIDQYLKGYSYTPSHIFTYYNTRLIEGSPPDEDTGGTLSGTIAAIKKYGICDSAVWPNDNSKFADKPSDKAYKNGIAGDDRLEQAYRVETVDEARQALAMKCLPYIGIKVYENFETEKTLSTGVIPMPEGDVLGGHALVIVGHHDIAKKRLFGCFKRKGYFIIRNSWGTGIGLNGTGYFTMGYNVLRKLFMDMWIVIK